jgi:putative peptide zinc metalloprotease protein
MNKMKKERLYATAGVIAAAVLVVFFLPLPFSVKCAFEVQPRGGQQVFTMIPGQIKQVNYRPGERVQPGDVLVKLENAELELELMELKGRCDEAEQAVRNLKEKQRYGDPSAVDQLDMAKEIAGSARKQFDEKQKEFERLTIVAPAAGTIIPPPARSDKIAGAQGRLPGWSGTPLDPHNTGAMIVPTELLCQIGDPANMEAVLIVDQSYIDLVREDQPVRLLLESSTGRALNSKIAEIAATEMKVASRGLSAQGGGRLETVTDSAGMVRPLSTSYQARAPLSDAPGTLLAGLQGQALIYTGWQPVWQRVYRYCAKTFHFDL